jgi:hypothetical protein
MRIFRSFYKYLAKLISGRPKPLPDGESPGREQEKPGDQRVFSRHWVSFPVIVSRSGSQDVDNQEKAVLRDISGGGALFISTNPENYYPGQLLKISILLDGTEDVKARIQTEAIVIRINKEEDPGKMHAAIAVQFDRSFEFERIDNRDSGPIG